MQGTTGGIYQVPTRNAGAQKVSSLCLTSTTKQLYNKTTIQQNNYTTKQLYNKTTIQQNNYKPLIIPNRKLCFGTNFRLSTIWSDMYLVAAPTVP